MGLFQKAEAGISGSSAMTMGAVNVVGLSAGYWRDQPVFTDLSFHIDGPGWFRLDGANGSGKSTLFEVLAGYLVPLAGSVSVNGQEVRPGHRVAGLKLQRSSPALVPGVTISDHLHLYGRRYGCSTEYLREISRELGLEEHINKPPEALSTGTRRKAWFVCNLAAPEPVWVLDEPFNGIDAETTNRMGELLKQQASDRLILLTSHSLPLNTQLIGNEPIGAFRLQGINYG